MEHSTLDDLTSDWFDASLDINLKMPRAKSVQNILAYSAGVKAMKTSRFGTFISGLN
ncbi:MAG: hypothetical protein O2818_04930 [Bacteroidetes bacterium]|nr:hypothetical protein [Bacteroidota bacterium]MDA1336214.1 hypothetical protein [Bacteroidota bacterium]